MAQVTIPAQPASPPAAALPLAVRRLLGQVSRRLRARAVLQGLGTASVIAAFGAVLGMAADFFWVLPLWGRWGIWILWLSAVGWVLLSRVLRPLVRRIDPLDLAAIAERAEPSLGERLTAAVGLLGGAGRLNGSTEMVAALARAASAYARVTEPSRLVSLRGSVRPLVMGGTALALVVAPGLIRPDPFAHLARRFVAPWADLDRVGPWVLTVSPGDGVAARGADLRVTVQVHPRFGRQAAPAIAWLEWTDAGQGGTRRVAMPEMESVSASESPDSRWLAGTRAFAVTLPRLVGSFSYRIVSGSAVSRSYRIRVIEPPSVVAVEARVEPPAYTGLPLTTARDSGRIEAWEGSRVRLDVTASRPIRGAEIGWPKQPKPVEATVGSDRTTASATLIAEESGPYTLALRDEQGVTGVLEPVRRVVVVRPDTPPVLTVQGPAPHWESGPKDTLRVAVAARDDVAVASAELHYAIQRGGGAAPNSAVAKASSGIGSYAVVLKGLGTRFARGEATLNLGPLGLKPGDTLSYRVRVADNRPAPRGPNVVWSPAGTLTIVAAAESLEARQSRAEREALQAKLDALKASNAENREETEQLRYAADAALRGNGPWDREHQQALTQREAEARGLSNRLQLLARELAADPRFGRLARPTRQIAEGEAEDSRALLEQAKGQVDPTRRLNDLRQADSKLDAVAERLDDLQRRLDALVQGEAEQQQLRDLARREAALADQTAETEGDRQQLDRLRAEQATAQQNLEALLKNSPNLRDARAPGQPTPGQTAPPGLLDAAREAMRQAARQLDPTRNPAPGQQAAQGAQQALNAAAQELNAAAQHVATIQGQGEEPGSGEDELASQSEPGQAAPDGRNRDPKGAVASPGTLDLSELKDLIQSKTGRTWGELPGHLRTEILQMSQRRYRDDYARLIQLYFQEIATGDSRRP